MSTWKTKNGDVIEICNMTNSHLINVAKLLIRFAKVDSSEVVFPDGMNEHPGMFTEDDYLDYLKDPDFTPHYEAVNNELKKRNISIVGWS